MSRIARISLTALPYHIMQGRNGRQQVFWRAFHANILILEKTEAHTELEESQAMTDLKRNLRNAFKPASLALLHGKKIIFGEEYFTREIPPVI